MSELYVDSSVVVAMLLEEPQAENLSKLLTKSQVAYSSYLLEAELFASAAREKIDGERAVEFAGLVSLVIPQRSLREEYRRIFRAGFCRGANAFHLATALYLNPEADRLTFVTADNAQSRLAKRLGFRLP